MKARILLGASALALSLTAGQAMAQDAGSTVEEVIVTATKRPQTLQEVPISLAAVSGKAIEERGIRQFTDLQQGVPNLQIDQTNGNYAITMRGLGSGAGNLAFEQSVGLFVDGVYSSRARSLQTAFLDVERVEVVRGPQGALFGKNTNAGAISIVTRRPTRSFDAEARVGGELENGGWVASGYVSGPLTDTLSGRVTAITGYDGAYMRNTLTHNNEYSGRYSGVRGQLLWEPTDTFNVLFKVEGAQNDINGGNIVFNGLGTCALCNVARNAAGGPGVAQETAGFTKRNLTDRPEYNDTQTATSLLAVNWEVGGWKLVSLTSYQGIASDQQIDTDVSALKLLDVGQFERSNQFFQEFRGATTIGGKLDVSTGVTYMKTKLNITQLVDYNGAPYGLAAYQAHAIRDLRQHGWSLSPYLALDYNITDKWLVSGSVRYNYEEKEADITHVIVGTLPASSPPYAFLDKKRTEKLWDYSAKVRYKITPDAQVYLSYATGTKGGGFVSNDGGLGLTGKYQYEPEKAKSWELGAKLRLFEGMGDLNVALFRTDFENLQVSSYTGASFTTGNAAEARSQGVEVETNWRPNRNFSFGGNLAYLDAKYVDYPGAPCVFGAPVTCVPATNNLAGLTLSRAPKWKGGAYVQAEGPLTEDWWVTGRVSADYTDRSYFQQDNNPANSQPSFTKIDARLALRNEPQKLEIALIGRNLTNEATFSQSFNVPIIGGDARSHGVMMNPSRTVAIEVVKKF